MGKNIILEEESKDGRAFLDEETKEVDKEADGDNPQLNEIDDMIFNFM